jgi:acyl-CoA synthetase (AMP-forming)/AMP-acid ligase II/thioesterase domain-containing protein
MEDGAVVAAAPASILDSNWKLRPSCRGLHVRLRSWAQSGSTVRCLVEHGAKTSAGSLAIMAPGRIALSYDRLHSFLVETAVALGRFGVDRSCRAATVLPTGPEAVTAVLAVMYSTTCVPLNAAYREPELAARFERLKVGCLVTQEGAAPAAMVAARALNIPVFCITPIAKGPAGVFKIRDAVKCGPAKVNPDPQPDDLALVMETSGTTGVPKRVPLTNRNVCASASHISRWMSLGADDRFLSVAASHHIAGIGLTLASLRAGSVICCCPGFYGAQFFAWLDEFRPTWFWASPVMLRELLPHARRNRELLMHCPLRFIRSGSDSLPPWLLAEAEEVFGVPVIENYGMTEASPQVASNPLPPRRRKPGSAGLPAGPEIMILGAHNRPAPTGEAGEILIRGPSVMRGYEDGPEANVGAFWNGWFRTGDLGYFDSEEYLFVRGRLRDMINCGGEKVSPHEIEDVLLRHPAVAEAVAFSTPGRRLTEEVAAAVVPQRGTTVEETELRHFVAKHLAPFKVPSRILVVSQIPKGPGGKVQRSGMAARLGLGLTIRDKPSEGVRFVPPSTPLQKELAGIWSKILNVQSVGIYDDFFDLGGDSFAFNLLLSEMSEKLGDSDSVLDWVDFLDSPTIAAIESAPQRGSVTVAGLRSVPLHPCVVALESRGSAPPFFMVPGIGGNPFYLLPLARHFRPARPFYALRDPRPAEERGLYSLEEVAERYVQAVRAMCPHGPYVLGGHCLGGAVAFEMAQCLVAAGEQVGLLALVEAATPGYPSFTRHSSLYLAELCRQLISLAQGRNSAGRLLEGVRGLRRHIRRQVQPSLERLKARGLHGRLVGPAINVEEASLRAARLYIPRMYPGRIAILCVEDHHQTGSPLDRRLGWRELAAGGVEVHLVPGNHFTSLIEPNVRELAVRLRTLADTTATGRIRTCL